MKNILKKCKKSRANKMDKIKTKKQAREYAISWQRIQSKKSLSYRELSFYQNYFSILAKRFNLEEEFKENGII